MAEKKLNHQVLTDKVAITQPAVRSVVVWADSCERDTEYGIVPVLGLYADQEEAAPPAA